MENTEEISQPVNPELLLVRAKALHRIDKESYEIKKELMQMGADEVTAVRISQKAGDFVDEEKSKQATKGIVRGSIIMSIGLLITIGTYMAGGRSFIVAYGALLGGLIDLCSGLYQKSKL